MGDTYYRPLIEDMTFSYSRLKSYEACPYGWKLNYIDKLRPFKKFYSSYGSLMHDVIAQYYNGKLTKPELPVEFLTRFSTEVRGLRPSGGIVEKFIEQGVDYLENFTELDLNPVAIEALVHFEVDGIPMQGFIDYLGERDGELIIVDHKSHQLKPRSGRQKPTRKDEELDQYLRQLYLYSEGVKEEFGKYPAELWFNCYRSGVLIKEQFDQQKFQDTLTWAKELVDKIKSDNDFDPIYEYFYCNWICDQNLNCEFYEEEMMDR